MLFLTTSNYNIYLVSNCCYPKFDFLLLEKKYFLIEQRINNIGFFLENTQICKFDFFTQASFYNCKCFLYSRIWERRRKNLNAEKKTENRVELRENMQA